MDIIFIGRFSWFFGVDVTQDNLINFPLWNSLGSGPGSSANWSADHNGISAGEHVFQRISSPVHWMWEECQCVIYMYIIIDKIDPD